MKTFRITCTALALSLSLAACANSYAFTTLSVEKAAVQTQADLTETLELIRTDAAASDYAVEEVVERIDTLVSRIDTVLDTSPSNELELIEIRQSALELRAQIAGNGTELVGEMVGGGPAPMGGQILSDRLIGEQIIGSQPLGGGQILGGGTSYSSGGFSLGGGGGGAAGGGAAAGGGFGLLVVGGAAAAIAIPLATDDDSPGAPASPSLP